MQLHLPLLCNFMIFFVSLYS